MLLNHKNAIIYGAGGSIGNAVANAFAREGAKVFLVGRTREQLIKTADQILQNGGYAEFAELYLSAILQLLYNPWYKFLI